MAHRAIISTFAFLLGPLSRGELWRYSQKWRRHKKCSKSRTWKWTFFCLKGSPFFRFHRNNFFFHGVKCWLWLAKKESSWFSRWWFQVFFIFTPTWGGFPIWLIFLDGLKPPTREIVDFCCPGSWGARWDDFVDKRSGVVHFLGAVVESVPP